MHTPVYHFVQVNASEAWPRYGPGLSRILLEGR